MISTTADLNRFYTALLGGRLLRPAQLRQMRTTVSPGAGFGYGLGLYYLDLPCGVRLWGHDGGIVGFVTLSLHSADGRRHLTASMNPLTGPSDDAVGGLLNAAFCDAAAAPPPAHPLPAGSLPAGSLPVPASRLGPDPR
jgi:D-alanyl-D-alanine carboxypeptidase